MAADAQIRLLDPPLRAPNVKPAIAQLVEHLTVECCSNQMVPGSIPGGRMLCHAVGLAVGNAAARPKPQRT